VVTRTNRQTHELDLILRGPRARQVAQFVRTAWAGVMNDDCLDLAAQISFYFSLSLFPFLIFIAAVAGWLPSTVLWHDLAQWITNYLPRDSRHVVFATIVGLTGGSREFLSFGLVFTLWAASSGFVSLMESLSVAYGLRETRTFWKKRVIAIFTTVIAALFLIVSFGLMTLGRWVAAGITLRVRFAVSYPLPWELARWVATLLLMLLGLDLVNYFLPNARRHWRWLSVGTVFVAFTVVLTLIGFNFYLRHFADYPQFYGAMAGFVILMTWFYLVSLILLIGAELDSVREKLQERRVTS
jgi:membrane protein